MMKRTAMIVLDLDSLLIGDSNARGLIICAPTGIRYTAQCGGMGCTHPSAEGFYLPTWDLLPKLDDCEYGCSNLTKSPLYDRPELRKKLADAIDAALPAALAKFSFKLRFDYDRIDELQEGWWPLLITGELHDARLDNHRCYYHAGNCD